MSDKTLTEQEPKRKASLTDGLPILGRKRKYELQLIAEVEAEEELMDDKSIQRNLTPAVRREANKTVILPKLKEADASPKEFPIRLRSKSVNTSFSMLKSFPGVTNHSITDADRAVFLKRKRKSRMNRLKSHSPEYHLPKLKTSMLYNSIPKSNVSKFKPTPQAVSDMRSRSRNIHSSSSSSARDFDNSDSDSINPGRSAHQSRSMSRMKRGRMKSKFSSALDKNNEMLKQIFKSICKHGERGVKKVTTAAFKSYLSARYPEALVETISCYFNFSEGHILEGYIGEFEKFLSVNDDRLIHFVFDVFDSNRDRYLCYADTFVMISQRKADYYDRDLLKLRQMFYLKKTRTAPKKPKDAGRRPSVYSTLDEHEDIKIKRKRVPYYNISRPEALTFEDFLRVEFNGKPQFLNDFLKYCCAIQPQELTIPYNLGISRQNTEDVLAEASLSAAALNLLAKDERASYFKELQDVISQFSHAESQIIMSKFKLLKASGTTRKMLSRESVVDNFSKFFGVQCDYIAERFFDMLSGRKGLTVTKPRYCKHVLRLLRGSSVYHTKWAFDMYDADRDGIISVDDLYDMQISLPPESLAYQECSRLVNIVVKSLLSINGKTETFDIDAFSDLIPESVIVKEILESLTDPTTNRINKSFEVPSKIEADLVNVRNDLNADVLKP